MSTPYMPLWVADYESDTAHLSVGEDGAYNRLLRLQWRTPGCTMPDDEDWIRRRVRASDEEWEGLYRPILDEFFSRRKGRVYQARLHREWERINATSLKRSSAGKKGGRPRKLLENYDFAKSPAKAKQKQPEPEPEPELDLEKDTPDGVSKKTPREILSDVIGDRMARAFIEYRQKARKPVTEVAAERLAISLRNIAEAGYDPADAIGLAIERGWQSIKLEWVQNSMGRNSTPSQANTSPASSRLGDPGYVGPWFPGRPGETYAEWFERTAAEDDVA